MLHFKVGWGYSELSKLTGKDHETKARELPIRAVRNEDCFLEFPAIASISSRRTFCGGWPGFEANVCIGDSGKLIVFVWSCLRRIYIAQILNEKFNKLLSPFPGGGFYIQVKEGWLIQGIVSASYLATGSKCNVEQYAVFTKVSSFSSWINMVISHDDSETFYKTPVSMDCKIEQWVDLLLFQYL